MNSPQTQKYAEKRGENNFILTQSFKSLKEIESVMSLRA